MNDGIATVLNDPQRRHDFVLLFDVVNGNPNGDPDAGNMPRVDPETMHGIVTDVSIKRHVRDYVAAVGQPIFIQSEVSLNRLISDAFREVGLEPPEVELTDEELLDWFEDHADDLSEFVQIDGHQVTWVGESTKVGDIRAALNDVAARDDPVRKKFGAVARELSERATKAGKEHRTKEKDARQRLCRSYYDIRMFGAVLQTGLNAGQVRGPMQLTFAQSLDPVAAVELAITRKARTTAKRMETGTTEMGRKAVVPYGLYRAYGFFNPHFAAQTGVSAEDLGLFWEALGGMWDVDRSASRGLMACRGVYLFSHASPLGNAPAHKLFERMTVTRRADVEVARGFADYEVLVDDGALPEGVTLTRLWV